MERLHDKQLAALVRGRLLCGYNVADHSPDEHVLSTRSF
jgi:hypothetical protein